jgi:hypothetical protein
VPRDQGFGSFDARGGGTGHRAYARTVR